MNDALADLYEMHHTARRGERFVLEGGVRGSFLRQAIGIGKRVLDIGCRDGALTQCFVEGNTVMGIDIDASALGRAEKDLNIKMKQVDLNGEWGIEDGSFDIVVAAEVIEHLYYPSVVIDKIVHVLTPGGMLIGSIPNAFSLANRFRYLVKQKQGTPLEDPTHITHVTVQELSELLKRRFEKVSIIGYGRLGWLARTFPQTFAFGLLFTACGKKVEKLV